MKKMTFEERFAQAVAIEPWSERMDALVMLIHEDPTAYVEAAQKIGVEIKIF